MEKKLEVKDLKITFKTDNGLVQAVRNISFDLYKGETLCIVGESGSGKSVTSKAIMGILANNAIVESGSIIYEGENLLDVSEDEFHKIRGHKIGMIFQDPLSSLNPIVRIGKQITEATLINADKIKQKYEDMISKELMAYKNAIAHISILNSKAKSKHELLVRDLNDRIKNSDEIIRKMASEEYAAYENMKAYYSNLNNEAKSKHELLVRDLNGKIKGSKEIVKAMVSEELAAYENMKVHYSALNDEAKSKHESFVEDLKLQLSNEQITKDDFKKQAAKSKEEYQKTLVENKAKLAEELEPLKAALDAKMVSSKEEVMKNNEEYKAEIAKSLKAYNDVVAVNNGELAKNIEPLKAALDAKLLTSREEVMKNNEEYKVEMAKSLESYKDYVKKNKEELAKILPPLKEALDAKKVSAKAEIKEYVVKLKADYQEKIAALNTKYDLANKKQGMTKEDYSKYKAEYNAELAVIKKDYIDKTRITRAEAKARALDIMREVGIPFPEKRFKQYPFEFSGGMRQRIVIAIALTATPDVLICDEPTTALDVTIQAQILELINKLKRERNLSCIFITHDLGVVANMADRVAVMYAGKIVEYGKVEEIFFEPKHPYTWALLSSIPDVDSKERLDAIPGTPPDMIYPPKGDAFALRSKYALEIDFKQQPPFFKVSDTHYAATWLLHPKAPKVEMPKIVSERIKIALGQVEETAPKKKVSKKKVEEEVSSNE